MIAHTPCAPVDSPTICGDCYLAAVEAAYALRQSAICVSCGSTLVVCGERRAPAHARIRLAAGGAVDRIRRGAVPLALCESDAAAGTVRVFVADMLAWEAADAAALTTGLRSSFNPVARMGELGIVGNGCRGTKGVWRGQADSLVLWAAEVRSQAIQLAYAALPREHQVTADAVREDGRGWVKAPVEIAGRSFTWPLSTRIGWMLASERDRRTWTAKAKERDFLPLVVAITKAGQRALQKAAERWKP